MMGASEAQRGDAQHAATTCRWVLDGTVQGVGFRPFVYRLAHELGLRGWVKNRLGRVEIVTQGELDRQQAFARGLVERAPPLAQPRVVIREEIVSDPIAAFEIVASDADGEARISVPADLFMCDDCGAEMQRPGDRRYRYPFINCTQCGPRYTLIEAMPYDRPNTSMAAFKLCAACRREYESPADRRFHAEPIACPACGPMISFEKNGETVGEGEAALHETMGVLRQGRIVAVKGIGGYHLLCDATQAHAVDRLRRKKRRPHKPLAVMFPVAANDPLAAVREEVDLDAAEAALLLSPQRPIVLARRRADGRLPESIAPGLNEVGVFLPYSPLHQLLLAELGRPLVATSGNISGEPVLTDNAEAARRLAGVADGFLHHDRPIVRSADDAVYRRIAGVPRPIRLGRGTAPLELTLRRPLPRPVLAVGGHLKNNIALAWDDRLVISPHIGDMGSPRSLAVFEQVAADLPRLYGVQVAEIVCDAHPDYQTTRWAERQGLTVHRVWHHHAHAAAAVADGDAGAEYLVFTWDGVGLGEDGTLWGGEALLGNAGRWRRVGRLRPFRLPGGDQAARQPWRSAVSLCWETGYEPPPFLPQQPLVRAAWENDVNCPVTSAAGRLFDAAAALTGLLEVASFEGQGPTLLEACAAGDGRDAPELPCRQNDAGHGEIDWAPLVPYLTDGGLPVAVRAAGFHYALARAMMAQAQLIRKQLRIDAVALAGGVFQNRLLTEAAVELLRRNDFEVINNECIPVNDAGISCGQIIDYAARDTER